MSNKGIVWAVAALVGIVAAVSFALSASALVAVAGWAGVRGPLAWCAPVLADGGALAFSHAALVRRGQGRGARVEWASLGVLAVVSVAANVAHGLGLHVGEAVRVAVGVAVVGLAPVVVLVTTHTLASLIAPEARQLASDAPEAAECSTPADDVADAVSERDDDPADDIAAMLAMRDAGTSLRTIGERFGVHASTVSRRLAAVAR
ncbi:helix-turn-helix domain-containing protein [Isoptericola sp. NEAU-Y5]|uniref:Helix-turn-helix domain-containing protein n=1 Tax=Isoptericola luteus TaxID=2879484 RepID=A0ABS7ZAA3_9MICO|nr:helix-turn-helix domain-containing protein [Isoptericola sp. NEAU-Y5]MCA5891989.1 helix-turn-helix domain-containing protein [Isoptericola sp. NEAU-Y5]